MWKYVENISFVQCIIKYIRKARTYQLTVLVRVPSLRSGCWKINFLQFVSICIDASYVEWKVFVKRNYK